MGTLSLQTWAGADIPAGVAVLLGATAWRAATTTIKPWPLMHDMFYEAATEYLPMVSTVPGNWSAPCWTTPQSIAQRLHEAHDGTAFPAGK
eukprot:53229-Pyramimonas_sp.AAC.1